MTLQTVTLRTIYFKRITHSDGYKGTQSRDTVTGVREKDHKRRKRRAMQPVIKQHKPKPTERDTREGWLLGDRRRGADSERQGVTAAGGGGGTLRSFPAEEEQTAAPVTFHLISTLVLQRALPSLAFCRHLHPDRCVRWCTGREQRLYSCKHPVFSLFFPR